MSPGEAARAIRATEDATVKRITALRTDAGVSLYRERLAATVEGMPGPFESVHDAWFQAAERAPIPPWREEREGLL